MGNEVRCIVIYIDSDYKCHISYIPNSKEVEAPEEFSGKCPAYIEGFRYVPIGEVWIREDGAPFSGMLAPWRDLALLEEFQAQYEAQLAAADAAYQEGVNTAYD